MSVFKLVNLHFEYDTVSKIQGHKVKRRRFLSPANEFGRGLLLSPIPSVRLLILEIQMFERDTYVPSRCPEF